MRILCLLAHSLQSQLPTTTKRILPLMRKLREKGHEVKLQENLAMSEVSPGEHLYFLACLKYATRSFLQSSDNYDLILASKPTMGILAYLLSRKLNIPFALDIDDLEGISALDTRKHGPSLLVRKAAKVFVASRDLQEKYKKIRDDVIYLPNTTDLEFFDPEKYINVERSSEPTFVWSGIIYWSTNCELILHSLANLNEGRLYMIGDGPKRHYYEKLSEKLKLGKRVTFKGWVPDDEVPRLYKASDVGLLPFSNTLWHRCKCPSRLFEFMAMEIPFVCTVGEPAHMAKKLGCGLIAKPEIKDFTKKMEYAADHLQELKEGAKRGRKYLLEKQNFNMLTEKLEAELSDALNY